jgi:LL-diaminopimelate aminotransferase
MNRTINVARRIQSLPNYPFVAIAKDVGAQTAAGVDVIRMDMGSPDLPPPPAVLETMQRAVVSPDKHGYSGYRGIPAFRVAVADYYQRRFGVTLDPETEVLPLLGSKEGIVNLMLALVGSGDRVLVPSLSYPAYAMGAHLAEAEVSLLPMRPENGFLPVLEDVPSTERDDARIMWINFPNNPTSAFCDLDYFAQAVEFCRQHNILLASDNAYLEVVFEGGPAPSVLQVPGAKDVTVEFVTFSKSYNMAGWRLGAAVGNAAALQALLRVKSNMDSGHFLPIYEAGITALQTDDEWLKARNARYAARRDMLLDAAEDIRLHVDHPPRGTLYLWAQVLGISDTEYTKRALHEAGISMAPGSLYGEDGKGYVRLSLGVEESRLEEAIARLKHLFS